MIACLGFYFDVVCEHLQHVPFDAGHIGAGSEDWLDALDKVSSLHKATG